MCSEDFEWLKENVVVFHDHYEDVVDHPHDGVLVVFLETEQDNDSRIL